MVGKYDGPNDDPPRISCVSHWLQKKPREFTWVTGVVLAVLTVGVTGLRPLPWDQIGYWAVKIVTGVPEAILFFLLINNRFL